MIETGVAIRLETPVYKEGETALDWVTVALKWLEMRSS